MIRLRTRHRDQRQETYLITTAVLHERRLCISLEIVATSAARLAPAWPESPVECQLPHVIRRPAAWLDSFPGESHNQRATARTETMIS
jgi:hypothetical protein